MQLSCSIPEGKPYNNLQEFLNNAADEHVTMPHLSATFDSENTGVSLWAVSNPVIDENGKFIGVVGLWVIIGQVPVASPGSP